MTADTPPETRHETPLERDDRNFVELLQELRVIQTGVQILFAFLLTLAFTSRFPDLDSFQRGTYIATLLLAALTVIIFTAPAVLHRSLFRRGAKRRVVEVSSTLAQVGLVVLSASLTGAVLLVVDVVMGRPQGRLAAGAMVLACVALWLLLPWEVGRRHRRNGRPD
ncbi:DUF6328 family protein [Streptomyces sparsus]